MIATHKKMYSNLWTPCIVQPKVSGMFRNNLTFQDKRSKLEIELWRRFEEETVECLSHFMTQTGHARLYLNIKETEKH